MLKKILSTILLLLLFWPLSKAQYYNTGQEPSSLKWEELRSGHFRFIYPESFKSQALKTAYTFEESYSLLKDRYNGRHIRKFPVIIHNHSIESNGYVAWAPKRVELFPFPGQSGIPLSHIEQLALHELVHVTQMQALREGLSVPLEYIFGEQYPGALSVFTPFWFLEGDAVLSETAYSLSGRGRQPDFEKKLKSLLVENKNPYSYDKMISGSFRNYTPDHYRFGYQMAAYARGQLNPDVFRNSADMIARRPWLLNPVNISFRKDIGESKASLYRKTMGYLAETWIAEDEKLIKSNFNYHSAKQEREYINYNSPVIINNDSIIALKTSFTKPPYFVLLDGDKTEKKLFTPGIVWPYFFSYARGILTWAEQYPDPRWDNRQYSVIKTYNIYSGELKQLSSSGRLFSPAISPDGRFIAAVKSDAGYINSIVILDRFTGKEIKNIPTPANELPVRPSWDNTMSKIAFISFTDKGEGLMTYSTESGKFSKKLDESRNDLQSLAIRNDSIFYVSSISGIDNIYLNKPDGSNTRLSSSRFGVSGISLWNNRLVFSDYFSGGDRIASYPIENNTSAPAPAMQADLLQVSKIKEEPLAEYYESKAGQMDYIIKPYRKWKHLFNIHSWMPFYADVNNISFDNLRVSPGLTIMSQNHLSTLTSSIGYEYRDGDHFLRSSLSWRGWYPGIDLDISYGGDPVIYQDNNNSYYPEYVYPGLQLRSSIYLPLRFRTGKYSQTLWPSLGISYKNNYVFEDEGNQFDYGQVLASARIYFSNIHRMAVRDIWPAWGQVFDLVYTAAPGDQTIYGPISTLRGTMYFPGFVRSHGIRLKAEFEKQEMKTLIQSNRISLPRGYSGIISSGISSFKADYTLPLAYPDFNLGSFIYLKRIRSALFYDYARGRDNYHISDQAMVNAYESFSSVGAELLADFYLMRLPFNFSGGMQFAWLPQREEPFFNIIFRMDVFGFVIGREP